MQKPHYTSYAFTLLELLLTLALFSGLLFFISQSIIHSLELWTKTTHVLEKKERMQLSPLEGNFRVAEDAEY